MASQKTVQVRCRFARAGFSHERKFMIDAPSGGFYTGTAYIGHCFKDDGSALPDEEPPPGEIMEGLIEARIVKRDGDTVAISVPDGEVCDVSASLIQDPRNVLVES